MAGERRHQQVSHRRAFAEANWLVGGVDGSRTFVRCFNAAMTVRENIAGDVPASGTTMLWNVPRPGPAARCRGDSAARRHRDRALGG